MIAVDHHTHAIDQMISRISARLDLLKMIPRSRLEALGVDVTRTQPLLDAARAAIRDGILDYVLITAEK